MFVNPYIKYVQAVLIFGLGYLVVNSASGMVYTYVRRVADHATAATLRAIARISGIAVLVSLMASVLFSHRLHESSFSPLQCLQPQQTLPAISLFLRSQPSFQWLHAYTHGILRTFRRASFRCILARAPHPEFFSTSFCLE